MNEKLKQWRQSLFLGYHYMFRRYPWQWTATLSFGDDFSSLVVNEMLIRWIRELQTSEHIQIAYVSVICIKKEHPHVHLLIFGRGKHRGDIITLDNVNPRTWASKWPYFAKVEKIKNLERATRYVASHTFRFKCDDYEMNFYNMKLLSKFQIDEPE